MIRYFGSWLAFTCQAPGQWTAEFRGHSAEIERRRAEPGCPAGWYLFTRGNDGEYMGSVEEAAAEACTRLDQAWRATQERTLS